MCVDLPQAEAVINQAVAAHGRVDGVVNCVGSIVLKSAHTTSDADFEQVGSCMSVNRVYGGNNSNSSCSAPLLRRLTCSRHNWCSRKVSAAEHTRRL
jgi:NAD(P)-dependent dehydrogenase (short-subunit alcohol dehydrogenase family)